MDEDVIEFTYNGKTYYKYIKIDQAIEDWYRKLDDDWYGKPEENSSKYTRSKNQKGSSHLHTTSA